MSAKKNTEENTTPKMVSESAKIKDLRSEIKGVAGSMTGGLAGIIKDQLTAEELKRLKKKIEDIGVKMIKVYDQTKKNKEIVSNADVSYHVPAPVAEDDLATTEMKAFSGVRKDLRSNGVKVLHNLSVAIDKAYVSTNESDWDALKDPITKAEKFNADVAKHLESLKSK